MENRKVRAVVTTRFGCQERTDWYPEDSPDMIEAVQALAQQQTDMFSISWEEREDDRAGLSDG